MLQPDKLKKLNENAAKMAAGGSTEQEIIAMKDAFIKQFGNEAPVQKKKLDSELSSEVGSSDSQESPKRKAEQFTGFSEKDLAKMKQTPEEKPNVEFAKNFNKKIKEAKSNPVVAKPVTEEDYFTGTFGNVLRGFDDIVPLGIGDFVDDISRSVASGYRQGEVAETANDLLLKGYKATPEQIQKFIDANKDAQQLKPSDEFQNYNKIYEEEGKGFWGVVKGIFNNPTVLPELITSSLVSMATNTDALKAGGAALGVGATRGAIIGATVTPEFAGAGAIPGAVSGAASAVPYAFGLASSVVEAGATFGELLQEELEGKDFTKENVRLILENPEKLQSIRNKAIARGIIIGTADALTGKLASGVGAKILTKTPGKSGLVKATAAGSSIESLGGAGGEALARAAVGQDMDVSEIALEGLAELPGGVRSTIQARLAKPSYKVNGVIASAEQVDNLINTMTPAQLATTKIEMKNDFGGRGAKIRDKVLTYSLSEEVKKANPNLNKPSLAAVVELEKSLKTLEGNSTQTGKDKAAALRQQIKNIQENQLEEEAVTETTKAETKPLETLKPQQDAVQEQSTTEVPVQSEAITSETMETGVSEPGPEVVTEQVKEEEVVQPEAVTEQAVEEETKPVSEKINVLGQEVDMYTNYLPSKENVDENSIYVFRADNKEGLPEVIRDKATVNTSEINGVKSETWSTSIDGKDLSELYSKSETEQPAQEVAPTEAVTEQVETAPVVEDSQPKKEQWEIDFERREGKLNEFNSENRPLVLEKERVSLSERKNSEEKIKLQDEVFEAQQKISRADDADLAIEEYNKKKQELEEFDKETQNIVDYKKVNDIIIQEIEWKENDGDNYEFPQEFNKDPREAALKRTKEMIDFLEERGDENDLESIDRGKNEIKILEKDIKDNPLKENTLLREPQQVEAAPVVESVNDLLDLDTTDQTSLQRVFDYLDRIDSALDLDPNELNDVTRVMATATAKAIIKSLKALVNAGITLQEAIKRVSAEQKVTPDQIIEAMNIVSKINENKSEGVSEIELPGFNELSKQVDTQIKDDSSVEEVLSNVQSSETYKNATDVQKEALVRNVRKRFGLKEKSAPSVGKLFGIVKDIKKITMTEKDLLIKQIKDKAKGAKEAVTSFRLASEELAKEIKELKEKGNITATQAVNIISKFSKVNLFNETSVSNFVDYMSKVFADADYDNKINIAKRKIKNAKKNIATKIGIADGLASPLQTLFSINPSLIPIKNLEKYIELVNMFSERKEVLKLDEISQVTKDVNEILDEINNEQSLVPELADRLNNSDNKVTEDGVLNYADTVKKMLKEGDITQEEADLMVKYKNEINPQEGREKKTDAEIEAERKELESEVKNSTINANDLPTRDERTIAKKIAQYLKTPFIKQFTNSELKNLIKVIDNINNGYLPHQAELILEKLDGLSDGKIEANVIEKANLKKIAQLVNTTYNTIKSKITKKDSIFEMIRRTPLFNIDQILGNFKTEELFYALLGKSAKAEAKFSFELKTIQEKIKKAQDKVAKSFSLNPLESTRSSYKIKTYQLQLEYNSNPGDKRVNPAADYIKATIKHIKKLKSQYNENDVEILEKILKDYGKVVGKDKKGNDIIEIDIDKLYNSFNSAEKESIKLLQDLKNTETEKAEFTAAVIRGNRITPLNNYTHISVLSDNSNKDLDADISFANEYNESLRPSTKAKSLIERTPGAKPINFDAYSTALKSSKYVLMDYYLTAPIRTARKSIKAAEAELEKDGEMSKEQRRIFESINDAFDLAVSDLVTNSYVQNSLGQDIVGFISKQGYRAVLAGLGKSSIELLSNLGYVVYDPFTFYKGMQYMGVLLSEDGSAIMNNSKSVQTNRVYASGLSGRMIDVGILNESVGTKSSKTRGKIASKAQQVWNLTIKRFIKNPVELTADALISSPDKVIMRPYWLGSYITELENQLGRKVTNEDLKKIAENDEQYMSENEDAIEAATQVADRKSKLMGATKNGFTGLLRGKVRKGDEAQVAIIKNFNAFMTNFMVYEYNAAKTGVMAAIGDGTMSKSEGAAVLAGVITRMTVYNLLIKSTSAGVAGLLGLAFGFDDEEEEEDKALGQVVTQSLASTFSSLMLGRDFGNISKTAINYAFEEYVTKEYLEGLRTGEYDPYKDAVLFNSLQPNERTGEIELWENIPNFMGSYGPMAKTAALGIKVITANEKKTIKAKERQEKERNIRLPLEILGNAGYIPLYKEIRKSVMDDIYKDLKKSGNKKVRVVKAGDEFK
jgi:hypothetical protein